MRELLGFEWGFLVGLYNLLDFMLFEENMWGDWSLNLWMGNFISLVVWEGYCEDGVLVRRDEVLKGFLRDGFILEEFFRFLCEFLVVSLCVLGLILMLCNFFLI